MSAGQPNWAELHRMGKLPKDKAHLVLGAAQNMELGDKLKEAERKLKLALSFMPADAKKEFRAALKANEPEQPEIPDKQPDQETE